MTGCCAILSLHVTLHGGGTALQGVDIGLRSGHVTYPVSPWSQLVDAVCRPPRDTYELVGGGRATFSFGESRSRIKKYYRQDIELVSCGVCVEGSFRLAQPHRPPRHTQYTP